MHATITYFLAYVIFGMLATLLVLIWPRTAQAGTYGLDAERSTYNGCKVILRGCRQGGDYDVQTRQ